MNLFQRLILAFYKHIEFIAVIALLIGLMFLQSSYSRPDSAYAAPAALWAALLVSVVVTANYVMNVRIDGTGRIHPATHVALTNTVKAILVLSVAFAACLGHAIMASAN